LSGKRVGRHHVLRFDDPLLLLAGDVFAPAGYASMDRQVTQLKRFREKRKKYKRNHDDVSIR
jgi:hypothetical protein